MDAAFVFIVPPLLHSLLRIAAEVQFKVSDFGSTLQDSFDFEICLPQASKFRSANVVSAKMGLGRTSISKLRPQGKLQARFCNDHGQWFYWLSDPLLDSRSKEIPTFAAGRDGVRWQ
jgi:hypothetical protein